MIGPAESVRTRMFLYQAHCNRAPDQLGCIVGVEFQHQPISVVFNCSPASAEGSGDLFVGLASKDRLQDLLFTSGQRCTGGDTAGKSLFQEVIYVRPVPAKCRIGLVGPVKPWLLGCFNLSGCHFWSSSIPPCQRRRVAARRGRYGDSLIFMLFA